MKGVGGVIEAMQKKCPGMCVGCSYCDDWFPSDDLFVFLGISSTFIGFAGVLLYRPWPYLEGPS